MNAFDPKRGEVTVADYAKQWPRTRRRDDGRNLAPRTKEPYKYLRDRHILPSLGDRPIGELRVGRQGLPAATSHPQHRRRGRSIISNPCKIRGAGQEHSAERPFVDADIVLRIAQAIDERSSALVLLAGFGGRHRSSQPPRRRLMQKTCI